MKSLTSMVRWNFKPQQAVAVVGKTLIDAPYTATAEQLVENLQDYNDPPPAADFMINGDSIFERRTGEPAIVPTHKD